MLTITTRTGDYYGDGSSNLIWETHDLDGTLIAELYVSTDRHEIMNIWVDEDHRGEGHARRLYETATATTEVFHAPAAHRTPEGNAFAEAVGGDTITYPCDCHACDTLED
jgi:GNAT superfamily N-acetyltransferase